jgi:D-methionine transport system substrate-binding protein
MNTRRHFALRLLSVAGLVAAIGLGAATAQAQEKKTLTIGATAGSNFDQLKLGIKPVLEKKGPTWPWPRALSTPTCSSTSSI